jgi:putative transposase
MWGLREDVWPNYRRFYVPDALVFITAVTRRRRPYLASDRDIGIYGSTCEKVRAIRPFNLVAYVVLPDHFHWLVRPHDAIGDFSAVMHRLKRNFTRNYKKDHGIRSALTVWQPRFWDHVIRDEDDFAAHMDYIHWNPVKHGFVESPDEWKHSSLRGMAPSRLLRLRVELGRGALRDR